MSQIKEGKYLPAVQSAMHPRSELPRSSCLSFLSSCTLCHCPLSCQPGMQTSQHTISLLFMGHAHLFQLDDYCTDCNIPILGLPSRLCTQVFTLPGVSLIDLPSILDEIMSSSPDVLLLDFGNFHLLSVHSSCFTMARSLRLFLL